MKGPPTREFSKPTFAENCTTDDSTRGEGTPIYDQLAAEQERRAREQQEAEG